MDLKEEMEKVVTGFDGVERCLLFSLDCCNSLARLHLEAAIPAKYPPDLTGMAELAKGATEIANQLHKLQEFRYAMISHQLMEPARTNGLL